jgi:ParB family chromosome partitioning protein
VKNLETSGYSERHLGPVILRVRSGTADLYDIVPNPNQPRMGPKEDAELRKSILENNGLLEPILVEPHPQYKDKFLIIDGERRWTNSKILVEVDKRENFRKLPVQICDRTLSEDERLRAWVTIHMQRQDWSLKEKERTAFRLIELVGRVKAANILGITVKAVDKLKATFELSERMSSIPNPDASITYAREIMRLPQYLREQKEKTNGGTITMEDAIVKKINEGLITSSKQIRDLREILKEDAARKVFVKDGTTIDQALKMLPRSTTQPSLGENFLGDLNSFKFALTSYTWPQLLELKGKKEALQMVQECKKILETIENMIKQ